MGINFGGDSFQTVRQRQASNLREEEEPWPNAAAAATPTAKKLLYMQEASNFSTHNYDGMSQFLTNILECEGLSVDADGKLLCDGGLQLLRPDGSRMLAFPQSVRIYTLSKLVDCVLRYVK